LEKKLKQQKEKMKNYKTLKEFEKFDIVDVEGHVGMKLKTVSVAVMPFTIDDNGMIDKIGLLKEYNPFREGDFSHTLITGTIDYEDDSLLYTAKRELKEESGYEVPNNENLRWIYLGNFFPYKDSDRQVPTFAVDVTGIEPKEPQTDGTKKEELSKLEMIPSNNIMITEEMLPLSAFLRLFNYFYQKTIGNV
jgi:8-oxo-dGTP pyrophosphatase MutT (NUDIX family)